MPPPAFNAARHWPAITTLIALTSACTPSAPAVLDTPPEAILARLGPRAVDASLGPGLVRYLGFEASPADARPGHTVTLVHYWVAQTQLTEDYQVFVHTLVQGARGRVPHGDHAPSLPTTRWPPGKVIRDAHTLTLPEVLPAREVELRVGLYNNQRRMPVQGDGNHRILAGSFPVAGQRLPLPTYHAPRLASPPTLDGVIDEAEWGGAPWTEPFVPSSGHGVARVATRARLAWDPQHLYLAIEAQDPDILATFARRDDPVYQEEAVELFVALDHAQGHYVELQVSPRGTQFDASFHGGPRRNMNRRFNGRYRVAVAVDGTVEPMGSPAGEGSAPQAPDRSWTTEWAIDVASLGLTRNQPWGPGREVRINLFRVAKDRLGGRLVADESAWSPPLMGDFHNLERFGRLRLVEGPE